MNETLNMPESKRNTAPEKGDKVEVIKVLLLMVFSFLLGFALVILFLKPSGTALETPSEDTVYLATHGHAAQPENPKPEKSVGQYAPSQPSIPQPSGAPSVLNTPSDEEKQASAREGDAPPPVPPGRTPDGVSLDGKGFYIKCWDRNGNEHPGNACDTIEIFEKRLSTRLYVVDECLKGILGKDVSGKLSLGVELDLVAGSLGFWTGPSSDIPNVEKIAPCLRDKLAGLPIHGFDHANERYRIFFTVVFGDQKNQKKEIVSREIRAKKGSVVQVIKDRVRVRTKPVDGEIIGKISSGNQVQLISKENGWCQIITPNNNQGWMICDALSK